MNSLIGVYVEIISTCNECCAYCYNKHNLPKNDMINYYDFKKLVLDVKALGTKSIAISGGEPFLHRNLSDFLVFMNQQDMIPTVITNLTIYNEDIYQILCKYLIPIQITLDGPSSAIHDLTRGKDSFNKIISNIHKLKEMGYKGKIRTRMNLHMKNWRYIEELVILIQRLGLDNIYLSLINFVGGAKSFDNIIFNNNEIILYKIQESVYNLRKKYNFEIVFEGLNESIGCPYYDTDNIQCGLRISANGGVFPCQLFSEDIFCLGNIKQSSICNIINGEAMKNFLNLMHLRKYYIDECRKCAYKSMCATGCPAEAYNISGNIFTHCGKCTRNIKLFNSYIKYTIDSNNVC